MVSAGKGMRSELIDLYLTREAGPQPALYPGTGARWSTLFTLPVAYSGEGRGRVFERKIENLVYTYALQRKRKKQRIASRDHK